MDNAFNNCEQKYLCWAGGGCNKVGRASGTTRLHFQCHQSFFEHCEISEETMLRGVKNVQSESHSKARKL